MINIQWLKSVTFACLVAIVVLGAVLDLLTNQMLAFDGGTHRHSCEYWHGVKYVNFDVVHVHPVSGWGLLMFVTDGDDIIGKK